jgi:hypothetical protein
MCLAEYVDVELDAGVESTASIFALVTTSSTSAISTNGSRGR